jgi:hypothetical protein
MGVKLGVSHKAGTQTEGVPKNRRGRRRKALYSRIQKRVLTGLQTMHPLW